MFVDINVSYLESSADARWQTTNQRVYRGEPVYERARCKLSLFIYTSTFLLLFYISRSMADHHFQMKLDSIRAGAGATNPLVVK